MLSLNNVVTYYGPIQVLKKINLHIYPGEIVSLLGGNASGKTTTMKTILGLVKPVQGTIEFEGKRIDGLPTEKIVSMGIARVPEARRIFSRMTVRENLELGAFVRRKESLQTLLEDLEKVYTLFPRLKERENQLGGTLSGGEQQMLAMGRALMARPRLILMDEPSMGLSPLFVEKVFETIQEINRQGVTILLVEQNANMALSIASRGYVLQNGEILLHDTAENLLKSEAVRKAYLGEE
jgi:branched-chain amino acid transport system ATP-binding protein